MDKHALDAACETMGRVSPNRDIKREHLAACIEAYLAVINGETPKVPWLIERHLGGFTATPLAGPDAGSVFGLFESEAAATEFMVKRKPPEADAQKVARLEALVAYHSAVNNLQAAALDEIKKLAESRADMTLALWHIEQLCNIATEGVAFARGG